MANIKITSDEWEIAKEYFESGLSLSQIAEKTGISRGQLSKKSNKDGWSKETGKQLLIQKAIDVKQAKETMSEIAVSVHNSIVDDRTKALNFFANVTHKNLAMLDKKLGEETSIQEHLTAQVAYSKGRETWLGKEPTSVINNTQVNLPQSEADLIKNLRDIEERLRIVNGSGSATNS